MECERRIRLFALSGVVVLLTAFCGMLPALGFQPRNGLRVGRLEAELNEQVPDGSTWEWAEGWLAAHGFEAHRRSSPDGRMFGLSGSVPNDSVFETADIRIEFYFGPDGRLTGRDIQRHVCSP